MSLWLKSMRIIDCIRPDRSVTPRAKGPRVAGRAEGPTERKVMDSEAVVRVLSALKQGGVRAWIGGGWGIDALLGRQSREHDDLDLAIPAEDESSALELLEDLGYKPVTGLDWRPVRLALRDQFGCQVDLHPVVFDEHGDGLQANLGGAPAIQLSSSRFSAGICCGERGFLHQSSPSTAVSLWLPSF
jgi:lincosamide nucleotidyltransferase A/C/D/E